MNNLLKEYHDLIGQIEQPLCKYARASRCGEFVEVGKDGFTKEPTIFNKFVDLHAKISKDTWIYNDLKFNVGGLCGLLCISSCIRDMLIEFIFDYPCGDWKFLNFTGKPIQETVWLNTRTNADGLISATVRRLKYFAGFKPTLPGDSVFSVKVPAGITYKLINVEDKNNLNVKNE